MTSIPPPILGVLADPVRWQLMVELARSDRRVGELVDRAGKPQNLVSYHLGELRRAGIVTSRRSSADGRDVYYRADLVACRALLGDVGGALHPGLSAASAPRPEPRGRRRARPRLLFLCTGNSARSQMAEALAVHRSDGAVVARSAGSHPKPLNPHAVRTMAARGIDISGRRSTSLDEVRRDPVDRVITLCDKVREVCPELPGTPVAAHWSMPDPASTVGSDAEIRDAFERTADEIESRIALLLDDLRHHPPEGASHG